MNELALNSVPYFGLLISGIVTTLGLSMNSILTLPVLSFMMLELFWNQSFRFKSNLYKIVTYEMVNLFICSLFMVDFYVQFSKWNFIKLKWKWISYNGWLIIHTAKLIATTTITIQHQLLQLPSANDSVNVTWRGVSFGQADDTIIRSSVLFILMTRFSFEHKVQFWLMQ